jgi:hypothetical protein
VATYKKYKAEFSGCLRFDYLKKVVDLLKKAGIVFER